MPYESNNTNKANLFLPIVIAVLAIAAVLYLFLFRGKEASSSNSMSSDQSVKQEQFVEPPSNASTATDDRNNGESITNNDTTKNTPKLLMESLEKAIIQGTTDQFLNTIDLSALDNAQKQEILSFASQNQQIELRQVGVLEFNKKARWAIENSESGVIYLDVEKSSDDQWKIAKVYPMQGSSDQAPSNDALSTADTFVKTLLDHNFEQALKFTDSASISDAQIAGLCIMFEEGDYILNPDKPLNSLFQREGIAAFTVNLLDPSTEQKAQIEIALSREAASSPWKVSELNIEKLLKSYIAQVSGGDSYYTPMIKNPQGGDRLALYFEFNEGKLTTRAKRQLDIIAALLRTSSSKTLTLSGHADAIGSDGYNKNLSLKRAESVQDYLISKGLARQQIQLSAYGESMPRRDNETDQGRRANRRTEIYLDF